MPAVEILTSFSNAAPDTLVTLDDVWEILDSLGEGLMEPSVVEIGKFDCTGDTFTTLGEVLELLIEVLPDLPRELDAAALLEDILELLEDAAMEDFPKDDIPADLPDDEDWISSGFSDTLASAITSGSSPSLTLPLFFSDVLDFNDGEGIDDAVKDCLEIRFPSSILALTISSCSSLKESSSAVFEVKKILSKNSLNVIALSPLLSNFS